MNSIRVGRVLNQREGGRRGLMATPKVISRIFEEERGKNCRVER
jgi:hypothetical protein